MPEMVGAGFAGGQIVQWRYLIRWRDTKRPQQGEHGKTPGWFGRLDPRFLARLRGARSSAAAGFPSSVSNREPVWVRLVALAGMRAGLRGRERSDGLVPDPHSSCRQPAAASCPKMPRPIIRHVNRTHEHQAGQAVEVAILCKSFLPTRKNRRARPPFPQHVLM